MSLPFIRSATEKYDVYVCCQPSVREVFSTRLPEDHIILWRPPWLDEEEKYSLSKWKHAGLKSLLQGVRRIRPHVAVSVWADTRVHVLMALSGAKERIGFPMSARNVYASQLPWRRRQIRFGRILNSGASFCLGRALLTRKLSRIDYFQHHVEGWRQLAEALDLRWNAEFPWLDVPPGRLPEGVSARLQNARAAGQKIWLLHPGARTPNRRWPLERFRSLVEQVFPRDRGSVIAIDPVESPLPGDWLAGVFTFRPSTLAEFFRILSAADYVLCNDTGVSHAAAALGKRVVSIFSANLPQWFGPYQNLDLAAHADVCSHRPCLDRCVKPSFICIEAVTVEMVQEAVTKVFLPSETAIPSPSSR